MVRIALMLAFALVAAFAPARADDAGSASLKLVATLGAGGAPLNAGVKWRIFRAGAEPDGSRPLVVETPLPRPMATLPPGDYVIHVASGCNAMASITLSNGDARVRLCRSRRAPCASARRATTRSSTPTTSRWRSTSPNAITPRRTSSIPRPGRATSSACPRAPTILSRPTSTASESARWAPQGGQRRRRAVAEQLGGLR